LAIFSSPTYLMKVLEPCDSHNPVCIGSLCYCSRSMCWLYSKTLSIDVSASLRTQSFSNESEWQIDLSTVLDAPPQVVFPADAGLGGPPAASSGS